MLRVSEMVAFAGTVVLSEENEHLYILVVDFTEEISKTRIMMLYTCGNIQTGLSGDRELKEVLSIH